MTKQSFAGLGETKFIGQAYFRSRTTKHGGTQAEVKGAGRNFTSGGSRIFKRRFLVL